MNALAAFLAAERQAERALQEMRRYLSIASRCELAGAVDLADAAGAIAANKLAAAIRIERRGLL